MRNVMPMIAGIAGALLATGQCRADFIPPPWTRGIANSTYQEWNAFTSATGPNTPDVANNNPNGTAAVRNSEPTAFVTGGGNIYSFAAPLDIDVVVPNFGLGADYATAAILQVRALGTEIDPATVRLTPAGGRAP